MKYAIVASAVLTTFLINLSPTRAALAVPLPEFKNFANAKSSKTPFKAIPEQVSATAFYTGKPYDKSSQQYLFLFRSYLPSEVRWTTTDKAGFLDGANNNRYTPTPTSSFDYLGMLNWSTLANLNSTYHDDIDNVTFNKFTVKTNDGASTIQLLQYVSGGSVGTDYTYNCYGYTFGNSQYWIEGSQVSSILSGDGWKAITDSDKSGARIAVWSGHSANVTEINDGSVTKVQGKPGANPLTQPRSPSAEHTGTPTYYE